MNFLMMLKPLFLQPRQTLLHGYSYDAFWRRNIVLFAAIYALILMAIGVAFATYGTNILMPVAGILSVLVLLIVWVLPESSDPPLRKMKGLFFGFLVALLIWPDYLALDLPGLPWITAIRIFAVPMAFLFLISLSVSTMFRKKMVDLIQPTVVTSIFIIIFALTCVLSIFYSTSPGQSSNSVVLVLLNWVVVFFVSMWVFADIRNIKIFAYAIWSSAVVTSVIAIREWQIQGVPWAGHIPSFLAVDDPIIQVILSAKARSTTGIYRVQSKFGTPLAFAEFSAFAAPFVLYFAVFGKSLFIRFLAVSTMPLIFLSIVRTDSRLGATGFFLTFLLFLIAWGVSRWLRRRESIFGPAITLAYPAIFVGFLISTFVVGRLRNMVWGTKAQSFSSQAREVQWEGGIPKILSHPWGYGMGQGGSVLGFRNPAGVLTIDSHYLAVLLEVGIFGFLFYAIIFLSVVVYGSFALFKAKTVDDFLIIPCLILVSIFIVEKAVFAQLENHPLVYATLGAICALVYRLNGSDRKAIYNAN